MSQVRVMRADDARNSSEWQAGVGVGGWSQSGCGCRPTNYDCDLLLATGASVSPSASGDGAA